MLSPSVCCDLLIWLTRSRGVDRACNGILILNFHLIQVFSLNEVSLFLYANARCILIHVVYLPASVTNCCKENSVTIAFSVALITFYLLMSLTEPFRHLLKRSINFVANFNRPKNTKLASNTVRCIVENPQDTNFNLPVTES